MKPYWNALDAFFSWKNQNMQENTPLTKLSAKSSERVRNVVQRVFMISVAERERERQRECV